MSRRAATAAQADAAFSRARRWRARRGTRFYAARFTRTLSAPLAERACFRDDRTPASSSFGPCFARAGLSAGRPIESSLPQHFCGACNFQAVQPPRALAACRALTSTALQCAGAPADERPRARCRRPGWSEGRYPEMTARYMAGRTFAISGGSERCPWRPLTAVAAALVHLLKQPGCLALPAALRAVLPLSARPRCTTLLRLTWSLSRRLSPQSRQCRTRVAAACACRRRLPPHPRPGRR